MQRAVTHMTNRGKLRADNGVPGGTDRVMLRKPAGVDGYVERWFFKESYEVYSTINRLMLKIWMNMLGICAFMCIY